MFDTKFVTFLCLYIASFGTNASVDFIVPCHYDDAECIMESAKIVMPKIIDGFSELGMPSLNPLIIGPVNGDNGELKLQFKDTIITSLPQCKILKVYRPDKLKLVVELECPIFIKGHYKAGGKLFVLPIDGEGEFEMKSAKAKIEVSINLKDHSDDHGCYKFASFDYKYDTIEEMKFDFQNMFNGDKAKADAVNAVLKQSWKEVTEVLGKPVIREVITKTIKAIEKLFTKLSCKELELP